MSARNHGTTTWRLALVLRTWFVALLALPAFGLASSPPLELGLQAAETGQEAVIRDAPPLQSADGKPVDADATAESEEKEEKKEDAPERDGVHARAADADHGLELAIVRELGRTAPELGVPSTPLLQHRLHNRGPPRA